MPIYTSRPQPKTWARMVRELLDEGSGGGISETALSSAGVSTSEVESEEGWSWTGLTGAPFAAAAAKRAE